MKYLTLLLLSIAFPLTTFAKPKIAKESVAIIYNSSMPESKELAEYYASKRAIPPKNLVGLPLSKKGKISRKEYRETIEKPLRKHFSEKGWWRLQLAKDGVKLATSNKIKVLVSMYGVPFGVNQDKTIKLPKGQKPNAFTKLNCAAVDSELALLSVHDLPPYQIISNMYFKKNVNFKDAKLPFYMLVGRIDADSLATCKRMIDDAVETEKSGLWGMAYLDLAKKGSSYKMGDSWIASINEKNWKLGIPTTIDKNRDTFLTNYPMRDVAMYFGWYASHYNGPFRYADFKFKKGAVAVHLHSFSASNLRNVKANWVGPIIKKGAAATVGNVYEPYLRGTHHFDIMHDRLTQGYTLVESAAMAIPLLSWQNVVIGDPLYQPFLYLGGGGDKLKDDAFYREVRKVYQSNSSDVSALIRKLRSAGHKKNDGRYFETVGLMRRYQKSYLEATMFFRSAHKIYLLDFDKTRNAIHAIDMLIEQGHKAQAIIACKALLLKVKNTPESKTIKAMLNILSPPSPPVAKPNKKIPKK